MLICTQQRIHKRSCALSLVKLSHLVLSTSETPKTTRSLFICDFLLQINFLSTSRELNLRLYLLNTEQEVLNAQEHQHVFN